MRSPVQSRVPLLRNKELHHAVPCFLLLFMTHRRARILFFCPPYVFLERRDAEFLCPRMTQITQITQIIFLEHRDTEAQRFYMCNSAFIQRMQECRRDDRRKLCQKCHHSILHPQMTQMTQINYNLSGIIGRNNLRHLRHLRMKSEL